MVVKINHVSSPTNHSYFVDLPKSLLFAMDLLVKHRNLFLILVHLIPHFVGHFGDIVHQSLNLNRILQLVTLNSRNIVLMPQFF